MTIHEFSRTELLIGEERLKKLREASVMVFGVGGVGSHCPKHHPAINVFNE